MNLHFLFTNLNLKDGNVLIFFDTLITINIYLPDDSLRFCTFESQRMSNLTLAALTSRNRLDCINNCVDSVDCDSVNYLSESRMCQLGTFSESQNLSNLSYSYGWQHYSKSLCIYKYLKWPGVRFILKINFWNKNMLFLTTLRRNIWWDHLSLSNAI